MQTPTPDEELAARVEALKPRKGAVILVIPILSVVAVFVLYAVTMWIVIGGQAPTGERVTWTFGACPEAKPFMQGRVDAMGLGRPEWLDLPDGFQLTVTLPQDADVASGIPATLTAPGRLRAYPEDLPDTTVFTSDQIDGAAIRQDLTLIPWTVLDLDATGQEAVEQTVLGHRDGEIHYTLDGTFIARVSNLKGFGPEVEFTAEDAVSDRQRLQLVAARTIILDNGPLPCPVTGP